MVVPAARPGQLVEIAAQSDPGRDPHKQVNEDSYGAWPTRHGHLVVVCDGMGGHASGQQASQLAVATIARIIEAAPLDKNPGLLLKEAIVQAGAAVYQLGGNHPAAMRPGSTCVALLVRNSGTEIAHVGDSRIYVVRDAQIWQLTRDHSVVQQMIDRGILTPEQARLRPDANVITRALGIAPEVEVELRDAPFAHDAGDTFVLASDGLSDVASPNEILGIVRGAPSLEKACEKLIELANARGGPDNITVQLARTLSRAAGRVTELGLKAVPQDGTPRNATLPGDTLHDGLRGAPLPGVPGATPGPAGGIAPSPSPAGSLVGTAPSPTLCDPPGLSVPRATLLERPPAKAAFAVPSTPRAADRTPPMGMPPPSVTAPWPTVSGPANPAAHADRREQRKPVALLVSVFVIVAAILTGVVLWWVLAK